MFQAPFGVGFTPISFDRTMHVIPLENARKSIGQFDGTPIRLKCYLPTYFPTTPTTNTLGAMDRRCPRVVTRCADIEFLRGEVIPRKI